MAAQSGTFTSGHDLFGNFQLGVPRETRIDDSAQAWAPNCSPRTENEISHPLDTAPLLSSVEEIAATALKSRWCLYCRGRRYDYTAYFHNTKIFPEPPHKLLKVVEESYVQKNRLQSLLINYVLREHPQDSTEQIQKDLKEWEMRVHALAGTIGDNETTAHLQSWTNTMARRIWEHVVGVQRMDMPPGRAKELTSGFRRLWEAVWIRCASMKDSACEMAQVRSAP